MIGLSGPVLDAILSATHDEHVGHVARSWAVDTTQRAKELDGVVGQEGNTQKLIPAAA